MVRSIENCGSATGNDPTVGSDDLDKPRPSKFPTIYKKKFQKKYREIDDAISNDDWTYLQKLLSEKFILLPAKNKEEEDMTINLSDDPLLSIVVAYETSDLALRLVEVMSEKNLMASNIYGDTALHGRLVKAIAMKCQYLKWSRNRKLEIPLHKAALYGQRGSFWKLVDLGSDIYERRWDDGSNMLHYAVTGNAPDLAMEIANEYPELITSRNSLGATPLHLLLTIPEAFKSKLQLGFLDSVEY
ncbi:uncharacterized protein [Typha latifolia]|uniref:uncharacterized protein n=1 Tax=Typha latifolia TaxID=4733 RepID=UPI003C2D01CB